MWEPGSVVMLQSGGPPMTVVEQKGLTFRCSWFWRGEYGTDWFDSSALLVTEPSNDWDVEAGD